MLSTTFERLVDKRVFNEERLNCYMVKKSFFFFFGDEGFTVEINDEESNVTNKRH